MRLDDFRRRHSDLLDRKKEIIRECQNDSEFRTKWAEWRSDLIRLYSQAISEMSDSETKKDKIIFLKRTFSPAQHFAIVGAVGPIYNYERSKEGRERRRRRGGIVSQKERKEVLKRDRHACVACGYRYKKNLVIHHIIPVSSPKNTEGVDNLATLCRRCHKEIHGGDYTRNSLLPYCDTHEFWTYIDWFGVHICLQNAEGVGKKTIDGLYQRFGSVGAIKKASVKDLTEIQGVSEQRARMIKSAFAKS